jgi:hypothetical protein
MAWQTALHKSMHNAIKAYERSLTPSSPEDVRRAKALPKPQIHPYFGTYSSASLLFQFVEMCVCVCVCVCVQRRRCPSKK